ncbi:MAG TPA: F0F1 ATP synthase subunit B [Actinomycetota bacterium]
MLAAIFAAAEAGAEAENSLRVLPDRDELVWGALFFLVLVVALVKLIGPKVTATFEQRREKIQGQLEEAERVKRDADQIRQQYEQQLAEARGEAQKVIEEAKRTAESLRADIVAKAEAEAREILARAQVDVAGERDRAVQQLRGTLAGLSVKLAGQMLERELSSPETHRELVDRAIDELARSGAGA